MIFEILVGIFGLLVVILGFTTFNLLSKNEKAEDIIISQQIRSLGTHEFVINPYVDISETIKITVNKN